MVIKIHLHYFEEPLVFINLQSLGQENGARKGKNSELIIPGESCLDKLLKL
jgi:hypothetical protein